MQIMLEAEAIEASAALELLHAATGTRHVISVSTAYRVLFSRCNERLNTGLPG
jgi:hypothetical protein